jgi:hypothetical protein
MVCGSVSQVFQWVIVEIPSLFALVAQLASQVSLFLVGPFILTCLPLFLTLEKTPLPKWHSLYVNSHETPTRFLYPENKKGHVRWCRRRGRR